MNVGVVGLGKLGTPVAVTMAASHPVFAYDINPELMCKHKYKHMELGPTCQDDFQYYFDSANITYVKLEELIHYSDVIFVAVQTPHQPLYEGITRIPETRTDFDYTYIINAANNLAEYVRKEQTVVVISTVLPGTMRKYILPILGDKCHVVYNPYFIAMGSTMHDFLHPEFVLLGSDRQEDLDILRRFYLDYHDSDRCISMDVESAELTKVAYNTYISIKIAFANTIMEICHKTGCNVDDVTNALGKATDRLMSPKYLSGGVGDGGHCFAPGEVVITSKGPRFIEAVDAGDFVLSGDGKFHKVVKKWERDYSGTLLKVQVGGLPASYITPNHLVYSATDVRPIYETTIRDIRKNRRCSTPLVKGLSEIKKTIVGDLVVGEHWIPYPLSKENLERPDYATDDYCTILGWYLSEGILDDGRVGFCLNKNELHIAEFIAELLKKEHPPKLTGRGKGAKTSIKIKGNGLTLRYGCKKLADKLQIDGNKLAENKTVPAWVLFGDADTIKLVLSGMFRGDGHLNCFRTTLSTISYNLAYSSVIMLSRIGIKGNLRCIPPRVSKKGQKHKKSYEVRIANITDVKKLWSYLELGDVDRIQSKVYTRYPIINNQILHPVTKIEAIEYIGQVYNLWVEDTHNYIASIGLVSNCHPRDNIAMSWLAEELNLSHNIFDDIMMAREHQTEWLATLMIEHKLPKVILGKAFKPETNLIGGSPALLLSSILDEHSIKHYMYDPHVDGVNIEFKEPAVFLVSTKHQYFKTMKFPKGSIVIDPHRYIEEQDGVQVIGIGK